MIDAVMLDTVIEVKISGNSISEFSADLSRFKELIPKTHRKWDEERHRWIIRDIDELVDIPFIKNAVASRRQQLSLF